MNLIYYRGVLTPLSTIFQLYRGCKFYWRRKPEKTKQYIPILARVNMTPDMEMIL